MNYQVRSRSSAFNWDGDRGRPCAGRLVVARQCVTQHPKKNHVDGAGMQGMGEKEKSLVSLWLKSSRPLLPRVKLLEHPYLEQS